MSGSIDDVRILAIKELSAPAEVIRDLPRTPAATETVTIVRRLLRDILRGSDGRLTAVVGPCSIHDPVAALDYADRLAGVRRRLGDALEIVMRVYFEKPRTTVGWKGLINDPNLDGSFEINRGLRLARKLLIDINGMSLPAACEFLDTATPQYLGDLVGWAAIGARTTESQIHREMASGLSSPVGFKNGTDGDVRSAIDAVLSAAQPHHFLAVTKGGRAAIAATKGNEDCHVVLRGGRTPNFAAPHVDAACSELTLSVLPPVVMIDASHANSGKKPENQLLVIENVAGQIAAGDRRIIGVMLESHLVGGSQHLASGRPLRYGQSITDGCLGWEETVIVLDRLAASVERRRKLGTLLPQCFA